jgi:hypothetical protein
MYKRRHPHAQAYARNDTYIAKEDLFRARASQDGLFFLKGRVTDGLVSTQLEIQERKSERERVRVRERERESEREREREMAKA